MNNPTDQTWPRTDQWAANGAVTGPAAPTAPVAEGEPAPTVESPPPRRRLRTVAIALAFVALGAAIGVAAGYRTATPTSDRLRHQRDDLQTQLDSSRADTTAAQSTARVSQTKSDACQRLANDSKVMVDQWDQFTKLWDDPANQNVPSGSPQEQELYQKVDAIVSSLTFTRGLVTSDVATCTTTPTAT